MNTPTIKFQNSQTTFNANSPNLTHYQKSYQSPTFNNFQTTYTTKIIKSGGSNFISNDRVSPTNQITYSHEKNYGSLSPIANLNNLNTFKSENKFEYSNGFSGDNSNYKLSSGRLQGQNKLNSNYDYRTTITSQPFLNRFESSPKYQTTVNYYIPNQKPLNPPIVFQNSNKNYQTIMKQTHYNQFPVFSKPAFNNSINFTHANNNTSNYVPLKANIGNYGYGEVNQVQNKTSTNYAQFNKKNQQKISKLQQTSSQVHKFEKVQVIDQIPRPPYTKLYAIDHNQYRQTPLTEDPPLKKGCCAPWCWALWGILGFLAVLFGMLCGLGVICPGNMFLGTVNNNLSSQVPAQIVPHQLPAQVIQPNKGQVIVNPDQVDPNKVQPLTYKPANQQINSIDNMTIGKINPSSIKPNYNPVQPIIAPINKLIPVQTNISNNTGNLSILPIMQIKNITNQSSFLLVQVSPTVISPVVIQPTKIQNISTNSSIKNVSVNQPVGVTFANSTEYKNISNNINSVIVSQQIITVNPKLWEQTYSIEPQSYYEPNILQKESNNLSSNSPIYAIPAGLNTLPAFSPNASTSNNISKSSLNLSAINSVSAQSVPQALSTVSNTALSSVNNTNISNVISSNFINSSSDTSDSNVLPKQLTKTFDWNNTFISSINPSIVQSASNTKQTTTVKLPLQNFTSSSINPQLIPVSNTVYTSLANAYILSTLSKQSISQSPSNTVPTSPINLSYVSNALSTSTVKPSISNNTLASSMNPSIVLPMVSNIANESALVPLFNQTGSSIVSNNLSVSPINTSSNINAISASQVLPFATGNNISTLSMNASFIPVASKNISTSLDNLSLAATSSSDLTYLTQPQQVPAYTSFQATVNPSNNALSPQKSTVSSVAQNLNEGQNMQFAPVPISS